MSLPDNALIRIRPGDRVAAVVDIEAMYFQHRWILAGWSYEVDGYDVHYGEPVVHLKGDAPRRFVSARAFVAPAGGTI